MDKNTKNNAETSQNQGKRLSKPRIFFGISLIVMAIVMAVSFASYLLNWKADQSQAGTMLDKTVKSSNIFGKMAIDYVVVGGVCMIIGAIITMLFIKSESNETPKEVEEEIQQIHF